MKFKPTKAGDESFFFCSNEELICVNSCGYNLTEGKTYICIDGYGQREVEVINDNGNVYRYMAQMFRKKSDMIVDDGCGSDTSEIDKLKMQIEIQEREIIRLRRENALLARIHDLEKILEEA